MAPTAEQLQAALEAGDAQACLALFAGATERERQTVADVAFRRAKQNLPDEATRVAALAACSFTQLNKLGWRAITLPHVGFSFGQQQFAYQALVERRPSWLADWARMILEISPRYAPVVRRLVREGLCNRPEIENYWLGLLDRLMVDIGGGRATVRDSLLQDSALLDDVWRLFEIEGNGEYSLAAYDKYTPPESTWETALVRLAQEGKLPRARLLDASLDALSRDFAQFRAGWFSRFHEALAPTLDERVDRAERYLNLLASKIPPTVAFALNALTLLEKAGRLAGAVVLSHIGPALLARSKGTVQAALKLLDRAAEREPARKMDVALQAAEALRHEAADVQAAAMEVIERHGSPTNKALAAFVRGQADAVAASQRSRLAAWLGTADAKPAKATKRPPTSEGKTLLLRAGKIDRKLARLAGVDDAVAAVKAGSSHVPALAFTALDIPRLHPDRAITPIADLDELIDRFAAVLEEPGSPDDLERVLDGVSRLCAERPDDFTRRTGPLAKRARTLLKRRWGGAFVGTGPLPDLCGLAIAWTSGEMPEPTGQRLADESRTVLHFLTGRVVALAERARRGVAQLLLAAPTHTGAWLDPMALVERIRGWPDASAPPDPLDQVQALLRLAPDNRVAALRKSTKLAGEFGEVLRYALGANGAKIGPTAALWVAAARARHPIDDDPAVEARHPGLGPDAGTVARLEFAIRREGKYNLLRLSQEPAVPKQVALDMPTVLLHAGARVEKYFCPIARWGAPAVRWVGLVWPLCREPWFAAGAYVIGSNLDWYEAAWGSRTYIEPLLDSDIPLGRMGLTLLAIGLAAKEPGESGLATDALIAAIDDGRLDGLTLGERMAAIYNPEWIKAARWAKTLTEASRVSPLHSAVCTLALERLLAGIGDPPPRDLPALLEAVKELLIAQGRGLSLPETRDVLSRLQASGKTAKLAREILALENNPAPGDDAAMRALAGRLERAERWSR
jgi:hypothetical protein